MASKTPKIDIFEALDKLSKCDIEYFNKLDIAQKKSLAPIVLLRWLSGVRDAKQIKYLNTFVNPVVFRLYQHQDLLLKLMMASTTQKGQRFKWLKRRTNDKITMTLDIIQRYYNCSEREAKKYRKLISSENLIEMATMLGEDNKFIEDLKKNELEM